MEILELCHEDVLKMLPERDPWGHKGTFGKILLLCGSRGYTGAAYLSAMGALRTGAGMVYLGVPKCIYAIEAIKLNEPVVIPLPDQNGMLSRDSIPYILDLLPKMDAVLIGCGLGISEDTDAVLKAVLENAHCPVVVDADGISMLKAHKDIVRGRGDYTILTPHDGEFVRLGADIGENRMESAVEAALDWSCVMVLKGHRTCITDGVWHYRNCTGNSGMAVGGSGDVLAGIIVSLLGQGIRPVKAAACGAWLHGAAGDKAADRMGEYGMLPSDMLICLPRLMK